MRVVEVLARGGVNSLASFARVGRVDAVDVVAVVVDQEVGDLQDHVAAVRVLVEARRVAAVVAVVGIVVVAETGLAAAAAEIVTDAAALWIQR